MHNNNKKNYILTFLKIMSSNGKIVTIVFLRTLGIF